MQVPNYVIMCEYLYFRFKEPLLKDLNYISEVIVLLFMTTNYIHIYIIIIIVPSSMNLLCGGYYGLGFYAVIISIMHIEIIVHGFIFNLVCREREMGPV